MIRVGPLAWVPRAPARGPTQGRGLIHNPSTGLSTGLSTGSHVADARITRFSFGPVATSAVPVPSAPATLGFVDRLKVERLKRLERSLSAPVGTSWDSGLYGLTSSEASAVTAGVATELNRPDLAAIFSSSPASPAAVDAARQLGAARSATRTNPGIAIAAAGVGLAGLLAASGVGAAATAAGGIPEVVVTPPVPLGGAKVPGLIDFLTTRAQAGFPILSGLFGRPAVPSVPVALPGGSGYPVPAVIQPRTTVPGAQYASYAGTPVGGSVQPAMAGLGALRALPGLPAMAGAAGRAVGSLARSALPL